MSGGTPGARPGTKGLGGGRWSGACVAGAGPAGSGRGTTCPVQGSGWPPAGAAWRAAWPTVCGTGPVASGAGAPAGAAFASSGAAPGAAAEAAAALPRATRPDRLGSDARAASEANPTGGRGVALGPALAAPGLTAPRFPFPGSCSGSTLNWRGRWGVSDLRLLACRGGTSGGLPGCSPDPAPSRSLSSSSMYGLGAAGGEYEFAFSFYSRVLPRSDRSASSPSSTASQSACAHPPGGLARSPPRPKGPVLVRLVSLAGSRSASPARSRSCCRARQVTACVAARCPSMTLWQLSHMTRSSGPAGMSAKSMEGSRPSAAPLEPGRAFAGGGAVNSVFWQSSDEASDRADSLHGPVVEESVFTSSHNGHVSEHAQQFF